MRDGSGRMHADVVLHGLAKCSNESCAFCRGDEACEEAQLDPYIRHDGLRAPRDALLLY